MRDIKDWVFFDHDDPARSTHPAVLALKNLNFGDVLMPWGFTLQNVEGAIKIIPASEDDWRKEVARLNEEGIIANPMPRCRSIGSDCGGDCIGSVGAPFCTQGFTKSKDYYFCGCF